MTSPRFALVAAALGALVSCNSERKQECDKFLSAMQPLGATPTADVVDRVHHDVEAIHFEDQPLSVYAKNYTATLTVLSNTLKLKDSPSAPDGTDDVIKTNVKEAMTDRDDIERYCAE